MSDYTLTEISYPATNIWIASYMRIILIYSMIIYCKLILVKRKCLIIKTRKWGLCSYFPMLWPPMGRIFAYLSVLCTKLTKLSQIYSKYVWMCSMCLSWFLTRSMDFLTLEECLRSKRFQTKPTEFMTPAEPTCKIIALAPQHLYWFR
jgi:hypothetical protein